MARRWLTESYLVLRLGRARSHPSERGGGTDPDEALKAVLREEKVLSLDPAERRRELVSKQLDKNDVRKLLALLGRVPDLLVPLAKDLVEARRGERVWSDVDELGVLLRDLERFRDQVRDVLPDEGVGVEVRRIDLLREV